MMSELLMRLIDQDLSVVFYDMTTIRTYGLNEELEELRVYGISKESTINRQVMLGVVQTTDGIPLAHHVWPGNTAEVYTLLHQDFGVPASLTIGTLLNTIEAQPRHYGYRTLAILPIQLIAPRI